MAEPLTLMTVHAHPDDEAIGTGGILAKYAAERVRTVLVTCTGGELGEIADPAVATPETLPAVRLEELRRAAEILDISAYHLLGYRDSGMAGVPENLDPASFHQADLEEATGRLVRLVRQYRPQVLVTYDDHGFYGHPDHIKAHQVTVAAFDASGDPSRYPEAGPVWTPLKLYATAIPRSALPELARRLQRAGIELPPEMETPPEDQPFGTPDELITTIVHVAAYTGAKRRALEAHRSQVGADFFFLKLPPQLFREFLGREMFTRLASRLDVPLPENDLFAGLR